ncbi:hypothetical protein SAMN05216524_11190 [Mucilaginibacter sp. OK098]|nr:hypothetical protein SAMN05216524_11190 [Mucilaginibacter sp. OK098]
MLKKLAFGDRRNIIQQKSLAFVNRQHQAFIKKILIYCPKIQAKINGATIVASLSTINLGV